jgi:hypothetical protein
VPPVAAAAAPRKVFMACLPPQQGVYVAAAGVYLLTLCSIGAGEGLAPVSGVKGAASCNVKDLIDAVQFRLIALPVDAATLADASRLRNQVAYQCLGLAGLDPSVIDPFAPAAAAPTLLDQVRGTMLTDCDVPLAVVYWTATGGIRFLDLWSVRRRLTHTLSAERGPAPADARLAAGEAAILQFQEQVAAMAAAGTLDATVSGRTHFRYLPPAGMLPIQVTGKPGVNVGQFFAGKTTRGPVHFGGAALAALVRDSFDYPPIDLDADEMAWLYYCAENMKAANAQGAAPRPQPYVLFASGHIPYVANARFDLALWDYANYALVPPQI